MLICGRMTEAGISSLRGSEAGELKSLSESFRIFDAYS